VTTRARLDIALALALSVTSAATVTRSAMQTGRRTIWDGVYSEAQATRGAQAYKEHCGYCHRDNLTGGGSEAGAPAHDGPIFVHRWRDQPVSDLFVTIGTTMPQNKPDTLEPTTVIDVVSFLLKANGAPAGPAELPPAVETLTSITMPVAEP
jgi:alcohol dehydrogenase (cytochrome c)